jgi:hypothetical protein
MDSERRKQFIKLTRRVDNARRDLERWQLEVRALAPFKIGDFVPILEGEFQGRVLWLETFKVVQKLDKKFYWELSGRVARQDKMSPGLKRILTYWEI